MSSHSGVRLRKKLDRDRELATLIEQFAELADSLVTVTSCSTYRYNCAAWAAGMKNTKIAPAIQRNGRLIGGYSWPMSAVVPRYSIRAYEEVYETIGYRRCDDGAYVIGIEKVALYGHDASECCHVARQTISGTWTSKMGDCADIEHATTEDVEGAKFGRVLSFMSRDYGLPRRIEPPRLKLPSGVERSTLEPQWSGGDVGVG